MSKFVLTAQLQLQAPGNTRQVINQLRSQLQGQLNIPVSVTGSVQATKQIKQVTQQTQQATTAAHNMGKAFGASIKRFAAFNIATRAVGLLASKLSQAVDEAIEFQRQLVKISQVTGKTVNQLQDLTDTITRFATTLGVSSTALLGTTRILAQAGIQAEELKIALEALAKTTLAPTFDNITQTAEGAVAILAQFGQGVGALEQQLGAINAVAGQFAVESGDLISSVRRMGGVFRQAGGDLNELLALFTSVRATTRENAESISTGLRTIFTRIQRPQTIEYLKKFGVELVDLEGKFIGPYEAVRELSKALAGLDRGDIRFVEIAEQLGGFRQIGKVIPLLQQFEVAERARQAAVEGGNSLNKDAATAQQALAVQIEKTREKFLALIRSISETSTFHIMIKSLLGIANAFIKVAEAIKPLIPLIATFGAFKLAKGIGGFASGLGAGVRGKNQGGKIHAFASGGSVPGTGNRDTVPAMLTPGEFVIRKSSVNKIGAGTLASMNENGYAAGGVVSTGRNFYGSIKPPTKEILETIKRQGPGAGGGISRQIANVKGKREAGASESSLKGGFATRTAEEKKAGAKRGKANPASFTVGFDVNPNAIGGFILKPAKGTDGGYNSGAYNFVLPNKGPAGGLIKSIAAKSGVPVGEAAKLAGVNAKIMPTVYPEYYPGVVDGRRDLNKNPAYKSIANRSAKKGLKEGLNHAVGMTSRSKVLDFPPAFQTDENLIQKSAQALLTDKIAVSTIEGFIFEGMIGALTGAVASGGQSSFDFGNASIRAGKGKLKSLFGHDPRMNALVKAEAKRSRGEFAKPSGVPRKLANEISAGNFQGVKVRKLASGGGISGSDTVPAMLTPGEFVVNKKASQSIGYGNLNKMNKQGVVGFASGGPVEVQHFASGSDGTGVKPSGGGDGGMMKMFALQTVVTLATSSLSNMTKEADGSSTATSRMIDSFGGLVSTLATVAFALQAFGVQLSMQGVGGMLSGLGGKAKGALSSARGGLNNFGGKVGGQAGRLGTKISERASKLPGAGRVSSFAGGVRTRAGGLSSRVSKRFGETDFSKGMSVGKGKTFGMSGPKSITRRAGEFTGKLSAGTSKFASNFGAGRKRQRLGFGARNKGKGFATRLGGATSKVGGLPGKALGNLKNLAGPILAVGLAFKGITSIIDAYSDHQGKLNKAIVEGNAAKAEEHAANNAGAKAANNIGMGLIAAGAAFGPVGLGLGALAAVSLKLGESFGLIDSDSLVQFMTVFGGDTLDSIKASAKASALAGKYNKELAGNSKAAAEQMKEVASGAKSMTEAFASGDLTGNLKNAQKAEKAAREASDKNEENKTGAWGSVGRNILTVGGLFGETSGTKNARIDKENEARNQEAKARTQKEFEALQPQVNQQAKERLIQSGGNESFDDFFATLPDELQKQFLDKGIGKLQESYKNQQKAIQENIKYLQSLDFGLRDVNAVAAATSASMERMVASQETGFNAFGQAADILEQSMSSAAIAMDPKEVKASQKALGDTLKAFGANDDQVKKATGSMDGFYKAQLSANDALGELKANIKTGTSSEELKTQFSSNLDEKLKDQGVDENTRSRIQDTLGGFEFTEEIQKQIAAGDFSGVMAALEPLGEEMKEQVLGPMREKAKQDDILIKLTRERIQLEQRANEAKKKSIDIEMEAAQAIADFGGRQVTSEDKKSAINRKLDIDLSAAGIGSVGGGSTNELAAAQQNISGDFNALQQKSNLAAQGGKGAFGGVKGVEDDKRPQLEAAQQSLITATRARIALVKEEMDIIKRKNELEKSSLDKLLSGDIEGFFEGQAATGAASALRTGNQALIGSFSASSVGRGFQDLQGQNLPAQQMERIASGALGSLGVQDRRSAQVLSGNTAEEQAKRAEGQQLAGILGAAGAGAAEMAEMAVDAKLVVIKTQGLKMGDAANVPQPQIGGMASGGVVYANRGIFVPRGTDTVPAMLTPGEFVVNRASVQRGNNLAILQAMNNGQQATGPAMNRGGSVRYYHDGDHVAPGGGGAGVGISAETVNSLNNVFTAFDATVDKLKQMKLSVQLDPSTINVNFNNTSFLSSLTTTINEAVLKEVKNQIPNISQGTNGLSHDHSVLKDKP